MPAKDYKFISPGVFINEIDNSQLPQQIGDIGPVIIGRAQQGPALLPTKIGSFEEFVQVFGPPVPGGESSDATRVGNLVGPTYGAYAAQAWLRNNSPVTYVRLVGKQNADATADSGEAGWHTSNSAPDLSPTQGGAYGLFVFQSASAGVTDSTGSLAAIWYINSGSVSLSGTHYTGSATGELEKAVGGDGAPSATNTWIKASADKEFKVVIKDEGTIIVNTKFNFTNSSENFIRKVFNTNPTLSNTTITDPDNVIDYWLGESYEDEVKLTLHGDASDQYGVIMPLYRGSSDRGSDFRTDYSDPATGYFISQDFQTATGTFDAGDTSRAPKLFRLRARNTGRWASRNVKISISDIRASSDPANDFGTFSVLVRAMSDTDNRPKILEQFNNCNLNPASANYVGRKIGDKYLEWDDADRRWRQYGDFDNNSDFVYVEATTALREGKLNPQSLPFGVYGPPRFKSWVTSFSASNAITPTLVTGGFNFAGDVDGTAVAFADSINVSGAFGTYLPQVTMSFPSLRLRQSASEGNPTDLKSVYYGVDTTFNQTGRASTTIGDYTGRLPADVSDQYEADASGNADTESSWIFTLDDVCQNPSGNEVNVYVSGSRQADLAAAGAGVREGKNLLGSGSYRDILDAGANRFTTVLHGGFDGLDITEAEPFRNSQWDSTKTIRNSYALNSVRVAIDSIRDSEEVEFDIAAMPGITNNTLNRSLIDLCEDRADALAVVDLQGGYVPETENTTALSGRIGSVQNTINNKKNDLQINSSFGCAYYPWVQIQDTINGALIWAPPSVAAIGAMSYGQATQELWFAPAGFTRGGLSANSAAGVPVLGVRERLTSKDRDKLYEANINPIAQFPAEGIVIFGQKTLQVTPSALDRINVRRLVIFLKRQISRIAATLLFDQNVQSTWNRFRGQVEPLLTDVQSGLGLTDYKLVLDETTTTPDLIDRNIMFAKIFLKPARAIEFIAIDFVITDSGASFED